MARPKTAQPNHSLRKVAAVVATAVSGMSVYAQAAEQPKQEETITVVAAPAAQESAWGPAPTIAAKRSATATKTDTPIEKTPQSVSVVTRHEMEMRQPTTVKEALSYTPSVFSTRGSSTTYDVVTIRGFTTSTTVNTNQYLDGMKLQGNNYSEVSMDPYFLERVEVMRGPTSVLYGNSNPGGIVSMVSKRPTTEPLKEVQFKMGTDNLWQTGFDFSDAIDDAGVWSSPPPPSVSNHLRARFAAPSIRLSLCRNRLRTQKPPSRWIASLSVCLAAHCSIRSRSPSRPEKSQA